MRKLIFGVIALLALASSCNTRNAVQENIVDVNYDDIVSFIVKGYQCHWNGMDPEDMGLSPVYSYLSPNAGSCRADIDGDGRNELLIGDDFDGNVTLYDIFTENAKDGSLVHLVCGGERDRYSVSKDGTIIENGSNSASDSFCMGYRKKGIKLVRVKDGSWDEDLMVFSLSKFSEIASMSQLLGGYTIERNLSDDELALFNEATSGLDVKYTPISVATQVVSGINYRFLCSYPEDGNNKMAYVTIYKPLQGDAKVTGIEGM